jgi:SIR2-like domain
MASYLKSYYLNDRKLAQRALLEFNRALNSGRVIAFTGAMTTQGFGYGDWVELSNRFATEFLGEVLANDQSVIKSENLNSTKHRVVGWASAPHAPYDRRVALSMIGELVDQLDVAHPLDAKQKAKSGKDLELCGPRDAHSSRLEKLELKLAQHFRGTPEQLLYEPGAAIKSIWRDIGINRFATLNYDFELERLLMLTGKECEDAPFAKLSELHEAGALFWGKESSRISRILPNGRTVESDIVVRERVDRFIDFAVGSDDAEQHILHLHGRADDQKSMIFSYRDYDRHYRRSDMHRSPFEYGQRIMMGGNPILFIGLGMSEAEINRTLEDFISNSPYHRTAPTFLLWSSRWYDASSNNYNELDAAARENFRIDKLHRLGVLTIFDTDVFKPDEITDLEWRDGSGPVDGLINLAKTCTALPIAARAVGSREIHTGSRWRSMETRINGGGDGPICMWNVANGSSSTSSSHEKTGIIAALNDQNKAIVTIATGPAGWGKGRLASGIAHDDSLVAPINKRLFISAGFCFDSDSMLDAIARFLGSVSGNPYNGHGADMISRRKFFEDDAHYKVTKESAIIIVNGMERFFDSKGVPLSSELDDLLRILSHKFGSHKQKANATCARCPEVVDGDAEIPAKPAPEAHVHVKWLFLGSDRFRFYAESVFKKVGVDWTTLIPAKPFDKSRENGDPPKLISAYLTDIAGKTGNIWKSLTATQKDAILSANETARNRTGEGLRASIDNLRRSFFDAYLEVDALKAADISNPTLAIEILRALAFIGLPGEQKVLEHVPRIRRLLDKDGNKILNEHEQGEILRTLNSLLNAGLITKFAGFEDYTASSDRPAPDRFGLHRALMTEMRFRLGLPLSEAKLSTSFNMSLYVAQPVDGFIPEPDIHDELGQLIDHLIGAYKDIDHGWGAPTERAKKVFEAHLGLQPVVDRLHYVDGASEVDGLHRFCHRDSVACLRAALAVMRGYYSTTGLLTLDKDDRLIRDDRDAILLEHAERIDCLIDGYGKMSCARDRLRAENQIEAYGDAEPFYPDELVWLHNERAVVRLAMGDLHESTRSFVQALSINKDHVEFGDTSHNWRRIRLNQLTAEIESANIYSAERIIREILEASNWQPDDREAKVDFSKLSRHSREEKLSIAIARGYQGMCSTLRGETLDAVDDLDFACELLRHLDEQRAFAYFGRLYSVALKNSGQVKASEDVLDLAIDAAQSTKQMDLVHRSHILKYAPKMSDVTLTESERQNATRAISDALEYAVATGTHRVRTEASAGMAKAKRASGDQEVAMQYAADAITIATRFGLKLRMIAYRVQLGEILYARGDPKTGRELVRSAVKSANRIGYQRAVDAGQTALAKMT